MEGLDFSNKYVLPVHIGGEEFYITQSIISTWIVMLVLIILALVVRFYISRFKAIPKGFQNVIELIVEVVNSFTISTMGERNKRFASFYGSVFLFILFSNLWGLLGMRPPTSDLSTTFAMASMTFLMVQYYGIKTGGIKNYLKGFLDPLPFLLPLNVIGELANPVSLSFRLFGNIVGGVIIMGLIYAALPGLLQIGIPAVLHVYFDVFSGVLQAFIFVMLSMIFVSGAIQE
ncbi:MAG TPA: F0F1 ATP synthase subunit A [Defluviitaleaceae bacterium]|nr:F0F1 ATP synthase subunit A [Defluviitaleaceae bacterium]